MNFFIFNNNNCLLLIWAMIILILSRGYKIIYTIVCQNLLCTNRKKSPPNHFIGAASSNKVKASINNLIFALEIHLYDYKLLLAEFKKCKGVLIAFLHFTFLKQFKPVKDESTHLKFYKTMT